MNHMNRARRLVVSILPRRESRTAPGGTLVRPDERAAARRLYPPARAVKATPVHPPVKGDRP